MEDFRFKYTGGNYFIIRTLTADDFESLYKSDVKALIEGEAKDVLTTADNQNVKFNELSDVFPAKTDWVLFDMLIHGNYTVYLVELDKDGKATYDYAKAEIEVEEETPTEDYLKWVGNWIVTNGRTGYDISVVPCEANYLYYIDGWETGEAVATQMTYDRDWVYARYDHKNGRLYFYAQYLMTYDDEDLGTTVDEMFVGTYLTDTAEKVDEEGAFAGYDLASAIMDENSGGKLAQLIPESFSFDNGFQTSYNTMRYSRYCYDEYNWAHYNTSGVPVLKNVRMERTMLTKAVAEHPRTKAVVRRSQPKAHKAKLSVRKAD